MYVYIDMYVCIHTLDVASSINCLGPNIEGYSAVRSN